MADVRALLRNELASRASATDRQKKKRKLESAPTEIRKKLKPIDQAEESAGEENEIEKASPTEETGPSPDIAIVPTANAATENPLPLPAQATASTKQQEAPQAIDEDEWAAFERFVAAPTRTQVPAAVLNSGATISAAPVSAAELAKHEEAQRESRTKAREAELQGEQEEATRSLEEEFDEMEQLDERVKRLKEKREEILRRRQQGLLKDMMNSEGDSVRGNIETPGSGNVFEYEEDEDIDDEDDDEWDNWRFK
ncbi:hypothetical protein D8B26_001839 [Coccidioides posadasii str. Silveira]|uniref:Uncharacterized protein n=3 Tax=Coccidioides posadasii TaxID=199306 RepID=E9CWL1_COCPS|nr:hypothetical protein CPC735_050770 [Coccidioides posadasii C735 delta SOWgp]EER23707.1 hypothetical protein CPC735_050770 [Coccidioides posadasii C735 delta SOWgp]EFW21687.1 conserved hypothetical protein [Coccidioides posadasii str. Silveira]KMM65158.1 hypothetical protein CPAG_01510 [Coccidioides posadasii RMSCC 3488]QVM07135.1 hypothetical protein D8B26_001839 [Coccidioides posadasii str. Silveira]|eukprot:XP_003065852.1 hypothetical protein CPC735_050770 [Coccidioides posadasii C735 delta SOWgp]